MMWWCYIMDTKSAPIEINVIVDGGMVRQVFGTSSDVIVNVIDKDNWRDLDDAEYEEAKEDAELIAQSQHYLW